MVETASKIHSANGGVRASHARGEEDFASIGLAVEVGLGSHVRDIDVHIQFVVVWEKEERRKKERLIVIST